VRAPGVLQIIPELETGGAERTAVDVGIAAKKAGWRSLVASAGGRMVGELEAAGVRHLVMDLATKNPLRLIANGFRLARIVRAEDIDLMHVRSRAPGWSAWLASKLTGIPYIATYHGAYGQRSALKGLYNSVMARGALVIANSAFIAAMIRRRHGVPEACVAIIHRGTDLADFDPERITEARRQALREAWGVEPGQRIVLQVARLTPWKGQRVLIEALALLDREGMGDVVGILAGDDQGRESYRADLETAIAAAGLEGRVKLTGHCADVAAAISLSSAVVVASTEPEAFGRAAVEAQAMGKPAIVTRLGAVPETVLAPPAVAASERTGWHVEPGSPEALAACLKGVLALSETEIAALGARARGHARAHFSLERMTESTLQAYARVCGNRVG